MSPFLDFEARQRFLGQNEAGRRPEGRDLERGRGTLPDISQNLYSWADCYARSAGAIRSRSSLPRMVFVRRPVGRGAPPTARRACDQVRARLRQWRNTHPRGRTGHSEPSSAQRFPLALGAPLPSPRKRQRSLSNCRASVYHRAVSSACVDEQNQQLAQTGDLGGTPAAPAKAAILPSNSLILLG